MFGPAAGGLVGMAGKGNEEEGLVRCNKTLNGIFGNWQLLNVNESISFTLKPVFGICVRFCIH